MFINTTSLSVSTDILYLHLHAVIDFPMDDIHQRCYKCPWLKDIDKLCSIEVSQEVTSQRPVILMLRKPTAKLFLSD